MMQRLDVNGTPVDLVRTGSGRPLLYLHAEQFLAQSQPFLDRLSPAFDVIAPRHPGFTEAKPPADFTSVADLAYLYLDLLERLDLRDVVLVGASLGGWAALEMCVRSCERVSRLVLIASVGVKLGGREERDFADLFYLPDEQVRRLLFADPDRWAPDYTSLSDDELTAVARERQYMAYYGWRPYMHNPGLRRWLHRVRVPSLLIWGDQDGFAPPAYGRALAGSLPDAELRMIPAAGHYPQIEQAAATVDAIRQFAGE